MLTRGVTLVLDASVSVGTIVVLRDGVREVASEVAMRGHTDEVLMPAVLAALRDAEASPMTLDRVVCGEGPGSFTSLRVAAAIAKGLAQGTGCALYAVPSLALLVAAAPETRRAGSRWLAALDAMRDERYLALVTVGSDGNIASWEPLGLLPVSDVPARAVTLGAVVIGPGAEVEASPHASGILRCASLVEARGPVDLASWEPVYGRLAEAQAKREREARERSA